jgi:hypothetical protein
MCGQVHRLPPEAPDLPTMGGDKVGKVDAGSSWESCRQIWAEGAASVGRTRRESVTKG